MIQINNARLLLFVLCLLALNQIPLAAQRATHKLGSNISFQETGQNTTSGFVQRYVLTNSAGVIQYSVTALPFSGVAIGQYKAYAINYDGTQAAPNLSVGTPITAINGACVDTSNALPIGVLDCNNTTGNIIANITGQNTNAAFTQKYVLTDSIGKILQITNTPQYSSLSNGIYNVFSLNYETASGVTGLTLNANIFSVTGTCLALSNPLGYIVCLPTCSTPSVGGTSATTSATLCSLQNTGIVTLSGQTGNIVKWQTSTNGGTSWTDIANTTTSLSFINAANGQQYRAVINTGGVCIDALSTVSSITTSANACSTDCTLPKPSITSH